MGQAKRRKDEIERLKQGAPLDDAARVDERLVVNGIDLTAGSPDSVFAMARRLASLLNTAKQTGSVDVLVEYTDMKVDASVRSLADVPIACGKGCSHCCHTWVSVTAPEVFYIAKKVRELGEHAVAAVKATYESTKNFDFDERDKHAIACALLKNDVCSIYASRPKACRMAAAADAAICERSYRHLSGENIPTPMMYLMARSGYSLATAFALRHAGFSARAYEFNAALYRALSDADGEAKWLQGEDFFDGVLTDPEDVFADPQVNGLYDKVFP